MGRWGSIAYGISTFSECLYANLPEEFRLVWQNPSANADFDYLCIATFGSMFRDATLDISQAKSKKYAEGIEYT